MTARVSCAEHEVAVATWGRARYRVVVYRTHVQHETAKNFQLDLFDPSDGHYEYSAVVTNNVNFVTSSSHEPRTARPRR